MRRVGLRATVAAMGSSKLLFTLAVGLLAIVGCTRDNPLFCETSGQCDDPALPVCNMNASLGPTHTCIAAQPGADAASELADASGTKADAGGLVVPVQTGQAADLVLGQPDFVSNTMNNGGISKHTLAIPGDVTTDGTRLWVTDGQNGRVLQWLALPMFNQAGADRILGRTGFMDDDMHQISQTHLDTGTYFTVVRFHVAVGGNALVVSCDWSNRAMLWTPVPTTSVVPAQRVLGQPDFTSRTINTQPTASTLADAEGSWTDGTRLVIADSNRILIWNSLPTANNQPADLVLGRPNLTANSSAGLPEAAKVHLATSVHFDGTRFYAVQTYRISVWNSFPTENAQPADYVIGQPNFESNQPNAGAPGPNDFGFDFANDIAFGHNSLFVSDQGNNRILVFTPVPTETGARAVAVLGQPNIETNQPGTSATALHEPHGITVAGDYLFAADTRNARVLRYTLSGTPN